MTGMPMARFRRIVRALGADVAHHALLGIVVPLGGDARHLPLR